MKSQTKVHTYVLLNVHKYKLILILLISSIVYIIYNNVLQNKNKLHLFVPQKYGSIIKYYMNDQNKRS